MPSGRGSNNCHRPWVTLLEERPKVFLFTEGKASEYSTTSSGQPDFIWGASCESKGGKTKRNKEAEREKWCNYFLQRREQKKNQRPFRELAPVLLSGRRGSNPRPSAWEADALSTELLPLICSFRGQIYNNYFYCRI